MQCLTARFFSSFTLCSVATIAVIDCTSYNKLYQDLGYYPNIIAKTQCIYIYLSITMFIFHLGQPYPLFVWPIKEKYILHQILIIQTHHDHVTDIDLDQVWMNYRHGKVNIPIENTFVKSEDFCGLQFVQVLFKGCRLW